MKSKQVVIAVFITLAFVLVLGACSVPVNPLFPVKGKTTGQIPTLQVGNTPEPQLPGPPIESPNIGQLMYIPAGTFMMGSPASEPGRYTNETQHEVTLTKAFYMSRHLITQKQYQDVMGSLPANLTSTTYGKGDNYPVYYVSWYDAIVFCNKLSVKEGLTPAYSISGKTNPSDWGAVPTSSNATWNAAIIVEGSTGYRLPTEAQWEYACRAGTTKAFNWNTDTITSAQANYYASTVDANNTVAGTCLNRTSEVGDYAPNAWGLYDMHGNLFEWCGDWYADNYGSTNATDAKTDPTGAVSGAYRVLRGGSWDYDAPGARSAYRGGLNPYSRSGSNPIYRFYFIGFRLVRP